MELALIIYFIDHLLEAAAHTAGFLLFATAAYGFLCVLGYADKEENKEYFLNRIRLCIKVFLCLIVLIIIIPKKDTAYAMLAAYGAQSVAELEQVQRMAPKSLRLLELTLDKKLSELTTNEENQDE